MRGIHKPLLPIIVLMSATVRAKAQKESIIPDGGYGERRDGKQPIGWCIASDFSLEQVQERRPESSSTYAFKIWLNGGSTYLAQLTPVKGGK